MTTNQISAVSNPRPAIKSDLRVTTCGGGVPTYPTAGLRPYRWGMSDPRLRPEVPARER